MILDLDLKELSAHAIHDDLVATLGLKAVAYRTMTCYLPEAKLGTIEVNFEPEPNSSCLEGSERAILIALDEKPFSSV
jgi:hypothetical protein